MGVQWLADALAPGWVPSVEGFFRSADGHGLLAALAAEVASGHVVYPADPLRALRLTPLADVRVVILGQDPYHGPGQAEGLAFSVVAGQRHPPSLRNMFKERQRDLGLPPPTSGSLAHWARAGVLLLNTCLTVREGAANSHARLGWRGLTDELVRTVAAQATAQAPVVFLLWGAHAQARLGLVDAAFQPGLPRQLSARHLVLCANHPSPLSASRGPLPFLGCGHFGEARQWLAERGVAGARRLFENDSQYEHTSFELGFAGSVNTSAR